MTTNAVFSVVIATYVSSEEARTDLSRLKDLYWENSVSAYDAAIVVTDPWGQVRVETHTSQEDVLDGPLHEAFTALFGGPFVSGLAPHLPGDRRVPHKELLSIGDAIGPSAVRTVALILGRHATDPRELFPHADAVETTSVESTAETLSELASVIADAMRSRRKV